METDPTPEELPPAAVLEETPPPLPTEGDGAEGGAEPEPGDPADPLTELAERSMKGRLAAAEEERAVQLLSAALLEGREGVARAVAQLPKLPWIVGVNGVTAAWPEMKPTMRNRLLAGLARLDSEPARRVRLSLARGLFKLEPAVSAKLAVGVAKEMRDKETGAMTARNAQVLANVLIGRAKPWLAQLPLADLKPAEADLLVHGALMAVFLVPHAPVTQLGVLKWAAEAGKLEKLHPLVQETVIKGLGRWSGRWQGVLRREVAEVPAEILATLKPDQPPTAPERKAEPEEEEFTEGREPRSEGDDDAEDDEDEESDGEEVAQAPKQRPIYESKTVPSRDRERERDRRGAGGFNLTESLRQIESHVASLRAELSAAQTKLRQRDDKPRKPERGTAPIIPGEPTAEELARLNVQLEARNAELQARIEELTVDSEDRAASNGLLTDTPVADVDRQLRNLLILKLKDDHEDFLALESESPDVVAPKHYRTVLAHVFEVLGGEGILGAEEKRT